MTTDPLLLKLMNKLLLLLVLVSTQAIAHNHIYEFDCSLFESDNDVIAINLKGLPNMMGDGSRHQVFFICKATGKEIRIFVEPKYTMPLEVIEWLKSEHDD